MAEVEGILERRLVSRPVGHPPLRGVLNLQLACAHFVEEFEHVVGQEGLTASAFNVLRILRGHPDGHPRGEIARRLVFRKADVTRIIDGLVRRGLVERVRSAKDRRLSLSCITAKGLKALARLDGPLNKLVSRQEKKLAPKEWIELNRLLEALYEEYVD